MDSLRNNDVSVPGFPGARSITVLCDPATRQGCCRMLCRPVCRDKQYEANTSTMQCQICVKSRELTSKMTRAQSTQVIS